MVMREFTVMSDEVCSVNNSSSRSPHAVDGTQVFFDMEILGETARVSSINARI